MRHRAVTLALLLLPCTAVACADAATAPPRSPPSAPPPGAALMQGPLPSTFTSSAAVPAADDRTIVRVAVRQLDADPVVACERMRIVADGGVVTLEGTVASALARRRAVAALQVVRGVRAIVDRLLVAAPPPDTTDDLLSLAVAAALARDPAIPTQERVAAQVQSGTVRLSGTVESNVGRRLAEEDAALVPGVRRVINDLAVDPVPPRPRADRVVAHQVDRVLESDPWLDRTDVRVAVERGVVRLQGTVRSAAERARAESDARAASPRAVDAAELRISDAADDGTLRAEPPATRPDAEIRQALADACRADPRIRPFVPEIDVRNGVVVLTGSAPNPRSERAVADDADDVPGVVTVRNAMRATPTPPQTDDTVRGDILDAVRLDPALGRTKLWVEAVSGRVILRGSVPNDTARVEALALAASVPGVTDVEDALIVEPPRLNRQQPTAAAGAPSAPAPRR